MFKQSVTIIDFPELYNVLYELKHLFEFNIYNYKYYKDFLSEVELNNTKCIQKIEYVVHILLHIQKYSKRLNMYVFKRLKDVIEYV